MSRTAQRHAAGGVGNRRPGDAARRSPRAAFPAAGAVLWTNTTRPSPGPVLPDGCTDLIWGDGHLLVAGPDTGPHLLDDVAPGSRYVGLRFAPGQGPAFFGVPAHELRDQRVPLADLWPADRVRELAERVSGATAPGRVLEEAAAARLLEAAGPADRDGRPGRTAAIAAALARGLPVAEVARSRGPERAPAPPPQSGRVRLRPTDPRHGSCGSCAPWASRVPGCRTHRSRPAPDTRIRRTSRAR